MIDQNRALESFLRYIAIDSETHHEKPMTELLVRELEALGLTVTVDRVGEDPAVESDSGNIFATLPGDETLSPMLFSAHQDTVTPGRGIRPRVEDGYVYSDGTTILGADDKSGVAAIMEALRVIREKELPHRPIEILFSVREEGGCGAVPILTMPLSAPARRWCWTPAAMPGPSSPRRPPRPSSGPRSRGRSPMRAPHRKKG